jgi:DNA-binding NarL/FixJ family response regulator
MCTGGKWGTRSIAYRGKRGMVESRVEEYESASCGSSTALVLDQYSLWLETVKRLAERAGIELVATTTSPQQAREALIAREPNLFILGLEPDSMDPSVISELLDVAASVEGLTTLVVGSDDDPEFVERCLRSGAYAYVLKTVHPFDLWILIRQAGDRSVYLFARPSNDSNGDRGSPPILTSRELQVLSLVAEGLSNAQVAQRLWISEPTVKYHLSRTYEKLGVSNRTGAARWAERRGLLDQVAS